MEAARDGQSDHVPAVTEEKKKRQRERDGLMLSRTRVLRQIEEATNERYRESLKQALGELDQKIAALDAQS